MTDEMKQALADLAAARKRVTDIQSNCTHRIVPTYPEYPESSDGICADCGDPTGSWYCPKNAPSHRCEYTRESGEWCIHCGDPSERL
jgi:hypothetical protein